MATAGIPDYEHRDARRLYVSVKAQLREPGTSFRFDVVILDISLTGLRFRTSFTLKPGTRVFLTIPTLGIVEAQVAWQRNFVYGAAFLKPIYPAVFDHLAKRVGR